MALVEACHDARPLSLMTPQRSLESTERTAQGRVNAMMMRLMVRVTLAVVPLLVVALLMRTRRLSGCSFWWWRC